MKFKRSLALAMALGLSTTLMACGNTADKDAADSPSETIEEVETAEPTEPATTEEATDATEETKDEETKDEETEDEAAKADQSPIYDLEFGYIPEGFVENFKDEKKDLRTVEYGAENNPAEKITVQIADNQERFDELVTVPEDAEDIKVGEDDAKFWDDGAFRYLVQTKGEDHIYARSTLDRDETIKVVEEIK